MNALQVEAANLDPLNQAALKFLKAEAPGWTNPGSPYVLNLMRWGLEEAGLSSTYPVEDALNRLEQKPPKAVLQRLTNPENLPGEVVLTAEQLAAETSAADAAALLLEQLT